MATDTRDEETQCPICGNWTWDNTDKWVLKEDKSPQAGCEAVSAELALLSAAKVKKENTPSGFKQPYVSVMIGNLEFRREYNTEYGAIKCAEKINKLFT